MTIMAVLSCCHQGSSDDQSADRDTAHESLGNVYLKATVLLCLVFSRTMQTAEDRKLFDLAEKGEKGRW